MLSKAQMVQKIHHNTLLVAVFGCKYCIKQATCTGWSCIGLGMSASLELYIIIISSSRERPRFVVLAASVWIKHWISGWHQFALILMFEMFEMSLMRGELQQQRRHEPPAGLHRHALYLRFHKWRQLSSCTTQRSNPESASHSVMEWNSQLQRVSKDSEACSHLLPFSSSSLARRLPEALSFLNFLLQASFNVCCDLHL